MPVPIPIERVPGSFDYYDNYEPAPRMIKAKSWPPSESMTTLPAQWMRDDAIFELEKRAIFSKVSCESPYQLDV